MKIYIQHFALLSKRNTGQSFQFLTCTIQYYIKLSARF